MQISGHCHETATGVVCRCCLQIEDTKRALFLYGNDASQTVKEAMTDLHKLKGVSLQLANQAHAPDSLWSSPSHRPGRVSCSLQVVEPAVAMGVLVRSSPTKERRTPTETSAAAAAVQAADALLL
jgi:hypothetical protein